MSVTITLYTFNYDKRLVTKTSYLSNGLTLTGNFKSTVNLINQTISLDLSSITFGSGVSILDYNYCYITELKRYYYISNIYFVTTNLVEITTQIDILMSNASKIKALTCIVQRNQNTYDSDIEDNKCPYKFSQNIKEETIIYNSADITFNPNLGLNTVCYAITYVRDGYDSTLRINTSPTSILPSISNQTYGDNAFTSICFLSRYEVNQLAVSTYNNASQLSFISSLIAFPFAIPVDEDGAGILRLGSTDYSSITKYFLDTNTTNQVMSPYYKLASFYVDTYAGFSRGYLAYEPYCKYELYLPYYGYTDIKYADVVSSLIEIYYSFDWSNGSAKINIVNATKSYVIKSLTATVGVKIAVNRTNNQEMNDEKTQLAIKSTISSIGSIASIGVGAYTHNPFMIAGGISSLTSTFADIGVKLNNMHERASASINSGLEGLYSPQSIRLKTTKVVANKPLNYASTYGLPLNSTVTLSSLSGMTLLGDYRLTGFNLTEDEENLLHQALSDYIIL